MIPAPAVLVVDPDELVRRQTIACLETEGYAACGAARAAEAFRIVEERPIDLVLVDVGVTPFEGRDLLRGVVTPERKIPTIGLGRLSRHTAEMMVEQYALAGFVVKPFENRDLLAAVTRSLA